MKADERTAHFYDVEVSTNKKDAFPPSMAEVAAGLVEAFGRDLSTLEINEKTATLEIADLEVTDDYLVALIIISDRKGADVRFSNPHAGTARTERKKRGEGREYGAHLCISLTEIDGRPDNYYCILEKNTGLHRAHVRRLLQAALRHLYQHEEDYFTCDHVGGARNRDGDPKQVSFRPMLDFTGHPSESFIEQIEAGRLKDITLIHSEDSEPLDGRSWLVQEESVLKLSARPSKRDVKNIWSSLLGLFKDKRKSDGFERARIKFKNEDTNRMETVEVDTETGNPIFDDNFVKAVRIEDIDPPLDESSEEIEPHFRDMLIAALEEEAELLAAAAEEEDEEEE